MKRIIVLAIICSLFAGAVFAAGESEDSMTEETIQIRLAHIDPATHPHHLASVRFGEIVAEKTDGRIVVEVYPAGQLGNAPNLMEQLKLGTIQIFQGGVGWWGSSVPDYWLVASNFVYDNLDHALAVMSSSIGKGLEEQLLDKAGIKVLTQSLIRNPRNLLTTRPIRNLDDLKGLKVRVPEMPNWMIPWEALGANPTPMPLTETYLGLQQGVVEGVEHGYPQLHLNGYTEVAQYLAVTEHQFETAGYFMNGEFFDSLSGEYQKILIDAARESEEYNNDLQVEYKAKAQKDMVDAGVEFMELDRAPWYEVGREIMQGEVVPKLDITEGLLEEIWAFKY